MALNTFPKFSLTQFLHLKMEAIILVSQEWWQEMKVIEECCLGHRGAEQVVGVAVLSELLQWNIQPDFPQD